MRSQQKQAQLEEVIGPPERLSALFHMVNRILPEVQDVLSISPDTPAREALALMREKGYSQLPVVEGSAVLGLFTYRAFALEIAAISDPRVHFLDLPVEEFLEHDKPSFARLQEEFGALIEVLDVRDAVIVSGPNELIAILTPMDVLQYLYRVASAFVLIEEIELTLRELIRCATHDKSKLDTCISNALSNKYGEINLPERLNEMTFDDQVALLRDGRNWTTFRAVFGGTRERLRAKLEPVRDLRNDVFHFRRELTDDDRDKLNSVRDWLYRCMRKLEARGGEK